MELWNILNDEQLKDSYLMVYANKQDLPNALTAEEIARELDLHSLNDRNWHVQPCCAINGDGLWKGMDWAVNQLCR